MKAPILNNETGLNGKTGIRVKIYRSITEVSESAWGAVAGEGRILCAHKFIEALEKSGFGGDRCYYPVVYDGNEIIAHTSAYFMNTEMDLCAQGAVKDIIDTVRGNWKNFFILRSLECGPPISTGNTISFKNGVKRADVFELLCDSIEGLAKSLGISFILFRDFYNDEVKFYDILKERGYMKLHNLPTAELKIRWKSFGEYLDSMHSNYRRKIVKRIDKCAKAGISLRATKNFSDNTRELKRLYDNVYDHAKEIKRERLSESLFQNINKYLGEKAVMIQALKDERLIGYLVLLFSGKTLISKFPGLDYDYTKECHTYFNLFYKAIELAIETGMDYFDMGITTLIPKKDMGASIVPLNMYMKHSNPFFNKVIPTLFNRMTPQDTKPRNVFK
ncbi:MAG: GNAT family N-acetyltransferase [Candidatus Omnitrophica bacterium]|nr:GNAT family N-acetyltransferase [Candidatus Omnitrophota bacterium]MBU4487911.1 GNAT family N-acetyltransferase [Candidatus Omnitrophota bacterium]MCG2705618.1 GNAT family N-acetyltransferase [Candidatus Omnitrophota bacterium]